MAISQTPQTEETKPLAMSDQFRALGLKVQRAKEHFAHVNDLLSGRSDPIDRSDVSGLNFDPERKTLQYEATLPTPRPEWGIAIGDVIHQLRSTLDHLICALATRKNQPAVCKDFLLSFPLAKNAIDFKADRRVSQGTFEHLLGVDEFAEVKRAQPYERTPGDGASNPLYILSQLDNIDKHRTILVLNNRLQVGRKTSGDFTSTREQLVSGTERLSIDWSPAVKPHEVDMDDISVRVAFAEPGVCNGPIVYAMLQTMAMHVEDVLGGFEDFF